jgi:ribosomal protein S27AE
MEKVTIYQKECVECGASVWLNREALETEGPLCGFCVNIKMLREADDFLGEIDGCCEGGSERMMQEMFEGAIDSLTADTDHAARFIAQQYVFDDASEKSKRAAERLISARIYDELVKRLAAYIVAEGRLEVD